MGIEFYLFFRVILMKNRKVVTPLEIHAGTT